MTTETQVPTGEETQNQSPAEDTTPSQIATATTPEIVTPDPEETTVESHEPETGDERDKTIRRLQRRIDKKHAGEAVALERARIAEERLALVESKAPEQASSTPEPAPGPADIEAAAERLSTIKEINKQANAVAAEGKKRYPDFKDALSAVLEEVGSLFDTTGFPTPIGSAILESDDAAALLHYLGKNQDVAAELIGLSPTMLGRRIDRIETAMKAKPKTSSAPKPLEPVKPSAVSNDLSDDLSPEEWRRRREKELRARRSP